MHYPQQQPLFLGGCLLKELWMNQWMNSRVEYFSKSSVATFEIILISGTHILEKSKETQTSYCNYKNRKRDWKKFISMNCHSLEWGPFHYLNYLTLAHFPYLKLTITYWFTKEITCQVRHSVKQCGIQRKLRHNFYLQWSPIWWGRQSVLSYDKQHYKDFKWQPAGIAGKDHNNNCGLGWWRNL